MTVRTIKRRLREIENVKCDYEKAHGKKDELYVRVLRAISKGVDNPEELATLALEAEKIDFPYHCA